MVRLDFCSTIGTKSSMRVTVEESSKEVTGSWRNNIAAWEGQWFLQNLPVHVVCVLVVERWKTCQHLVEEHTKSPPVDSLGISLTKEKLRSKIFWCTAEGCNTMLAN
jgi:hypothetical protein